MAEHSSLLSRRSLIRGFSLATLAVAALPMIAACGQDDGSGGSTKDAGYELVTSDVKRTTAPATAIPGAVAGLHSLGAGLYGALSSTPGNVALSPFSVAVALGLTANGAVGATQDEMLTVLDAADVVALDEGLNALTTYVESLAGKVPGPDGKLTGEIALDSANALFGQQDVTWGKPFLDTLSADFGAGMLTVDWKGASEAARTAVNAWTAKQTRDKITEILPAGSVGADTRLVLVNALYFKAPWLHTFEKDSTSPGDFHLDDGGTVRVPTMQQDLYASYAVGDGYAALRLPYAGEQVAMTLLLPDDGGLAVLEQRIGAGGLAAVLDGLDAEEQTKVFLKLPSWTFRTQVSLSTQLAALGMPTAFSDAADFSAMTTQETLAISDVLHEVFVAVDEAGTEAAAATAVIMEATSSPVRGVELTFDRPFVFVIHDVDQGTPLFVGRVADPRS